MGSGPGTDVVALVAPSKATMPEELRPSNDDTPGLVAEKNTAVDAEPWPRPETEKDSPPSDINANVFPAMGDASPSATTFVSPAACDHMKMASAEEPPIIGASNATCPFAFTKNSSAKAGAITPPVVGAASPSESTWAGVPPDEVSDTKRPLLPPASWAANATK